MIKKFVVDTTVGLFKIEEKDGIGQPNIFWIVVNNEYFPILWIGEKMKAPVYAAMAHGERKYFIKIEENNVKSALMNSHKIPGKSIFFCHPTLYHDMILKGELVKHPEEWEKIKDKIKHLEILHIYYG